MSRWPVALLLASLVAVQAAGHARATPEDQRAPEALDPTRMPDLLQTDARLGLPRGGRMACGPVAVANGLVFLAQQGWPRLVPLADEPVVAAIDVVRQLASGRYMNTSLAEGTSTAGLLLGVGRYVRDHGYEVRALQYAGWRAHPARHGSGRSRPDLPALAAALRRPGTVAWMNVGWYRLGDGASRWERVGGHWVTVAGQGRDADGREDASVWILRDPSPRSGRRARGEIVRLDVLTDGTLVGPQPELPQPARGVPRILEGLGLPDGAEAALVDGVVLLDLAPAAEGPGPARPVHAPPAPAPSAQDETPRR